MAIFSVELKPFLAALQICEHSTAVKDIRPYLNGIRFEVAPNGNYGELLMISTDGHRMSVVKQAIGEDFQACEFTLDGKELKALITAVKDEAKARPAGRLALEYFDPEKSGARLGMLCASMCTGKRLEFLTVSHDSGHYPQWRRVLPRPGVSSTEVPSARTDGELLNPEYLADAYKAISIACKTVGAKYPGCRTVMLAGVGGGQKAFITSCPGGIEAEIVIMGMKD